MSIFLSPVYTNVLTAIKGIRAQANSLQNLPASFTFDQVQGPMDQMGRGITTVQAFLAAYTDATVVQTAADKINLSPTPTTGIRTKMVAVDTAHGALATAYAPIYAGFGNMITFSTVTRMHSFATVQLSSLSSLGTLLNNLVAACDALVFEG